MSECITVIRSLSFCTAITICLDSVTLVCLIRPLCRTMGYERRRARLRKMLSVVFQKPKQITRTRRDTAYKPPPWSACNQQLVNMGVKRRQRSELGGQDGVGRGYLEGEKNWGKERKRWWGRKRDIQDTERTQKRLKEIKKVTNNITPNRRAESNYKTYKHITQA